MELDLELEKHQSYIINYTAVRPVTNCTYSEEGEGFGGRFL